MNIVERFMESWAEHPKAFDDKLHAWTGEKSESYRVLEKLNKQTDFIDANVVRLLEALEKLHVRYEMESDDEWPLFVCSHCQVPAPCPTMIYVHDIEEYVL